MTSPDSTRRFSDRVQNYVLYRPRYPRAVRDCLQGEIGLSPEWVIADIGSGTGFSAEIFLENGNTVHAVEPNDEMRQAGEDLLGARPNFRSVAGTAEATTLSAQSIDLVAAGQAFHWFDLERAREEFRRILRLEGWVALLWNTRRMSSTPFLRAYESLLLQYGTDYTQSGHRSVDPALLERFFRGTWQRRAFYNEQVFDLPMLQGRLLSSSYVPLQGQPNYEPMMRELERVYERHEDDGRVCFEYDTELYFGRV